MLTNKIIDQRLLNRNIKRLQDYINSSTKIEWQCLNKHCNYIWLATPNSIQRGSGCPKCAGKLQLTNDIVDKKLENRNIKRLNNYTNIDTKINWQCLIKDCNYIWKTSSDSVLNQQSGCPKCAGKAKLTNDDIDKKLSGRNLKRIDDYINTNTKIRW